MQFSIKNTTRKKIPGVPFKKIKEQVLGKKYELSLVFCDNALSRKLNSTYRQKDRATNVLSFEISSNSGEIFINLSQTKIFSAEKLFIHGLLHLKGMEHGDTMEQTEKKLLHGASNRSRH
ncbi:MAG: rRNA maturation RNase YbeY [Candidatus Zambryskibacteria bacterium]|nr:rRNA maturation RNase YbeY [Candidatus Zambryskibacteria bacterium]